MSFESIEPVKEIPSASDVLHVGEEIRKLLDVPAYYLCDEISARMYNRYHTDDPDPSAHYVDKKTGLSISPTLSKSDGKFFLQKDTPAVIVNLYLELTDVRSIPLLIEKIIKEPVLGTPPRWESMGENEKIQYLKDMEDAKRILGMQVKAEYHTIEEVFTDLSLLIPILTQTFGDRFNEEFERETGRKLDPRKIRMIRRAFEVFLKQD